MKGKSKDIFSKHAYNSTESAKAANKGLCELYDSVKAAKPTQFHLMIEEIAREGRLQRLYSILKTSKESTHSWSR